MSASVDTDVLVTEPGIYEIPEAAYHADRNLAPTLGRSLSSSGAKAILDSPARFAWQREHPVVKDAYDFGSAAHQYLLGGGPEVEVIDADSWRTKAAQEQRDAAREAGRTPILVADNVRALALVAAVMAHPVAGAIFASAGEAERSLYWIDPETGVTCRGRIDWMHPRALVDLKTTINASPGKFSRALVDYGYALQAEWYSQGYEAVTGERLPFVHVVVEKEPPHLVAVYQVDQEALAYGAERATEARRLFADCESSGQWPGYSPEIELVSLPAWAR